MTRIGRRRLQLTAFVAAVIIVMASAYQLVEGDLDAVGAIVAVVFLTLAAYLGRELRRGGR